MSVGEARFRKRQSDIRNGGTREGDVLEVKDGKRSSLVFNHFVPHSLRSAVSCRQIQLAAALSLVHFAWMLGL